MKPDGEFQVPVSSSQSEHETGTIGDRVCHVRASRSQPAYAKQLKIGLSTLRNYERNDRKPNADALVSIFEVDGVLSDWILRGEGPMRPGEQLSVQPAPAASHLDTDLLQLVVEVIEEALEDAGRELHPGKKAALIAAVYDLYHESESKPEKQRVLRLVNSSI